MVEGLDDVLLDNIFDGTEIKYHAIVGGTLLLERGAFDGDK
jgi:hypothetical protein